MKVGFIGLGIMGKPMAGHLLAGGHELYAYTRGAVPEELTSIGAKVCKSSQEVAQQADVIITMVPDTPDVEAVLFGANGIAGGISKGKTVVDMSSISPAWCKRWSSSRTTRLPSNARDAERSKGRGQHAARPFAFHNFGIS
ncbi:MAG: NAD(P)-binding domain-containing protein [Myxococcales bacterium]